LGLFWNWKLFSKFPGMLQLFLILFFMVLGIISQRWSFVPTNASFYLNRFLIYVILPALALKYIPSIQLEKKLLLPVLTAWINFAVSWLLFGALGRVMGWKKSLTGCLIIVAGLSNTSFVGIPMVKALYGPEAVQLAFLIDQAGSFIIVSSVAIVVASIYGNAKKRKRDITKKILGFPPFIFFCLAILMNLQGWSVPNFIQPAINFVASLLTPVALTAVGMQLNLRFSSLGNQYLWMGLGYKLLFIPALIFFLYRYAFGLEGLLFQVSVVETAMAPMITGSIIAISHDLEPKLASLLVGVGIPLSFLTVLGWYWIVG
jgi:predicted permease